MPLTLSTSDLVALISLSNRSKVIWDFSASLHSLSNFFLLWKQSAREQKAERNYFPCTWKSLLTSSSVGRYNKYMLTFDVKPRCFIPNCNFEGTDKNWPSICPVSGFENACNIKALVCKSDLTELHFRLTVLLHWGEMTKFVSRSKYLWLWLYFTSCQPIWVTLAVKKSHRRAETLQSSH